MPIGRFFVYLLGAVILFLSKALIPLALYGISKIFELPEHTVTYLLGKGPPIVSGLILALFGLDLLLMKRSLISAEAERSSSESKRQDEDVRFKGVMIEPISRDENGNRVRRARIFGAWVLVVGLVLLCLSLVGPLTAVYGDNEWPPLPYP